MLWLGTVSLLWAFSFGLIKGRLTGLDPTFVASVRLAISALVFAAWLRPGRIGRGARWRLLGVGAVQYGAMYVLYIASYRYLAAHQVALFTATTPLYVLLLGEGKQRRWRWGAWAAAALAVAGAVIVVYRTGSTGTWVRGLALVQAANLCFAAGQVWYRRLSERHGFRHRDVFAWLYAGGVLVALGAWLLGSRGAVPVVTGEQWAVLLYLGVVSSALGFFGWNVGATKVSTSVLAVFNNVKVPLAVLVSVLVFGEHADWLRVGTGGVAIALALYVGHRLREGSDAPLGANGRAVGADQA